MSEVKYSIIVATYNRLDELQELVESMERMSYPSERYELVISDDGSTDGTREYIGDLDTGLNVRYIHQENKGPGEARNHGMREAHGDYFIFMDSDCTVPEDYLTKLDEGVLKHGYDAFGGPDTYHPSFGPFLKAINFTMTSFIGSGGTRGSERSVTKYYPRSFNMGLHRKVYDRLGGMSRLRHGQDMDFSMRIYQAGYKVGLIPEAKVYHKRRTNLRRFFKQIFNWGVARVNLGRMYSEFWKPIAFAPAVLLAGLVLLMIVGLFWFPAWIGLQLVFGLGFLGSFIAFLQASIEYRSLWIGFLASIILPIQVIAYALGTWSGLFQWMMGKKEASGFGRNYYR